MIKVPGIVLSFDDWYIDQWHTLLPMLAEYDVKATFYLAFSWGDWEYNVTPERWQKLKEIQDAGHAIGYHGWNHLRADGVISNKGCKTYFQEEVDPGLEQIAQHGFNPRHYCYPYGYHTDESDRCLLNKFDTLRCYVNDAHSTQYTLNEITSLRIFNAYDIREQEWKEVFDAMIRDEKIGFFFAHDPSAPNVRDKLRYMLKIGFALGMRFYSMDDL